MTGQRRALKAAAGVIAIAAMYGPLSALARADAPPPSLSAGTGQPLVDKQPCAQAKLYPTCRRLTYYYGPLPVQPGNNAQLVGPANIQKPGYDGYMLRWSPDLVRADGKTPPVNEVHLHHAVWVDVNKDWKHPFGGAGEEKTIAQFPNGYGMPIPSTDSWVVDYMLHEQTGRAERLWLVYTVDFVPKADAQKRGIKPIEPVWLDVYRDTTRSLYPVFNVQKGYGHVNPKTGRKECGFPAETCAAFDPYGVKQPGNGRGWEWTVPSYLDGTIVWAAGHMHPGGLEDELSLERGNKVRRIFTSHAHYFDPAGPVSWDMAMGATPANYRVRIRPGDRFRLNAVYDTSRASWYEGMGIIVAAVSPGDKSGVDPFGKVRKRVRTRGRRSRAASWITKLVPTPIPTRDIPTHGHLPENDTHGGLNVRPLPKKEGPYTSLVTIAGYKYSPGDISSIGSSGIPRVREHSSVTFLNADEGISTWHTVTACKAPCDGSTGISYPIADASGGLDSMELGFGPTTFGFPTSNRDTSTIEPTKLGLKPGDVVTYFCRVHPFMRGAFKVVS